MFLLHPYTLVFFRIVLGGILIFAGIVKLIDMAGMAESIENYRILPRAWVNLSAIVMPALEVVVGIFLILGIWMDGALLITTGLFVLFILAVESAIWRGLNIQCGCFGLSDSEIVGMKVLIRDGLFLLGTLPLWIARFRIGEQPIPESNESIESAEMG